MGTPMQKMSVMFDSGSALMYMITEKCKDCPDGLPKFDTSASTTFKAQDQRQAQSYGTGQIEGQIA